MKLPIKQLNSWIKNFLFLFVCASREMYCSINLVTGLIVFATPVSLVQGATVTNDAIITRPSSIFHEVGNQNPNAVRDPRILKDLSYMNRQGCLAKVLCGIDVARPPSDRTSALNDYAYVVKNFFDIFSFTGLLKTLAEPDGDNLSRTSLDIKNSKKNKKKKNNYSTRNDEEDTESYGYKNSMSLEELLELRAKKRSGRILDTPKNGSEPYIRSNSLGITNPRFNKTMYLDRKQREYNMANDETEKLKIAEEVGKKFRSARQCRAVGFLNTNFSFCPFEATTLQNMLLNSSGLLTTTTTQKPLTLEELALVYGNNYAYHGFQDSGYKEQAYNDEVNEAPLVHVEEGWPPILDYDSTITQVTTPKVDESLIVGRSRYIAPKRKSTEKSKIVYVKQRRKNTSRNSEETEDEENENSDEDADESHYNHRVIEESEEEESYNLQHRRVSNSNENQGDADDESDEENDEENNESGSEEEQEYHIQEKTKQESKPTKKPKVTYSAVREAMNFNPIGIDRDYGVVSNTFARPDDKIVTYDRFLTGLTSTWDPNDGTWKTSSNEETPKTKKNTSHNSRKFEKPHINDQSQPSEEEEKSDDEDTTEEEEDNEYILPAVQSKPRNLPPIPQIRFRAVKFRGKRSSETKNLRLQERQFTNSIIRARPPEILNGKLKYNPYNM